MFPPAVSSRKIDARSCLVSSCRLDLSAVRARFSRCRMPAWEVYRYGLMRSRSDLVIMGSAHNDVQCPGGSPFLSEQLSGDVGLTLREAPMTDEVKTEPVW